LISCTEFIAEIGNLLDKDVASELRSHLEGHLAHCRTCQVIYDSARKTLQIVTDAGCFDLPETAIKPVVDTVMAKVRAQGGGGGSSQ
jgi:hypothetical protein